MHLVDENIVKAIPLRHAVGDEHSSDERHDTVADADIASIGSGNISGSEVESSSFPVEISDVPDGYSSEGEITMYSAETAESHNKGATSQKSNDYFSPTVSSIMKKRNNLEQQPTRPQQSAVHSSAKWTF